MHTARLVTSALTICLATIAATAGDIPAHPDDIAYEPLVFTPPNAADYRHDLAHEVPAYLMPSSEFPLVTVTFTFRGGAYLAPADMTGLSSMLGHLLRAGGTQSIPPRQLDEQLDFLAADISMSVSPEHATATLNCLKSNFDEAFALFLQMLREPGFDARRLELRQAEIIEELKQRNDSPMSVARLQLARLMYGPDHYAGRAPTQASIEAITPEALTALHQQIFHPGNLIVSATGDFDIDAMTARLNDALADWPAGELAPPPPAPDHTPVPGLYHADTAQADLPQGLVLIVQPTIRRDHPDMIPLQIMNNILGSGGFTSRITTRVRNDEGLAYSAMTAIMPDVYAPSTFLGFFQSRNETVALATTMMLEEFNRIADAPVTAGELESAHASFIETLPQSFASKTDQLSVFVNDERTGRPAGYWATFRQRVDAVSFDDIQRVAGEHLDPDAMIVLVIGHWDDIKDGDAAGRASMADIFNGAVTHLPLLDPLTLEPINGE